MDLFPIMLKLQGKKCIVIGGGEVAESKTGALLASGAQVIVVAPQACASIQEQAGKRILTWYPRSFVPGDVDGAFLVIAATNSPAVNEAVYRACTERGVLCNVADDPEHCHFFYPAVVRRGALQIAISTGGRSPALAHRLRVELEQQFGPQYQEWVEHLGRVRREVLARSIPADERRRLLEQIASPEAYEDFLRQASAPGEGG